MTELPAGSDVCKLVGLGFLGACRRRLRYGAPSGVLGREPRRSRDPRALQGIRQGRRVG